MKSPRLTLFLTTKSNTLLVKSVLMSKNGRSCKKWQKLKKNGRSWFVKSNSLFNSTSYVLADCLHPNFVGIVLDLIQLQDDPLNSLSVESLLPVPLYTLRAVEVESSQAIFRNLLL